MQSQLSELLFMPIVLLILGKYFEDMFQCLDGFSDDFMQDWESERLEDKKRFLMETQELEEKLGLCFGDQETD